MSDRTLIAWVDGDRHVFREGEIDTVVALGADADTVDDAWDALAAYARERDDDSDTPRREA